jgi:hypothetical protein
MNIKYIIIAYIVLLLGCTKKIPDNNNYKEIEVNLKFVDSKFICINLKNNTQNYIYIPDSKVLTAGLHIYGINSYNKFIDLTSRALYYSLFYVNEDEYKKLKQCCELSESKEFISKRSRDSISISIVENIKNRSARLLHYTKEWASRQLDYAIFLEPGRIYSGYFYLTDSLNYKRFSVIYSYPYPYPVIKKGPGSMSKELMMNYIKTRDSLSFNYPNYILGYKLYNKVIISKPIIINRE